MEVGEDKLEGEDRQKVRRMKKKPEKRSVIGQEKREADRKNSISGQETGTATQEACNGHSDQNGKRQRGSAVGQAGSGKE